MPNSHSGVPADRPRPYLCEKCGKMHTGCAAHRRTDPSMPCRLACVKGASVCRMHGGSSRLVRGMAAERVFNAQISDFLRDMDVRGVENPLRRLVEVTAETDAFYRFVAAKVGELKATDWESLDDKGAVQLKAMVSLLERAMDRVQKFLAELVRLGIEERMAKVDEKLAEGVVSALDAAMAEVGMDNEQRTALRLAAGRHLAAVA